MACLRGVRREGQSSDRGGPAVQRAGAESQHPPACSQFPVMRGGEGGGGGRTIIKSTQQTTMQNQGGGGGGRIVKRQVLFVHMTCTQINNMQTCTHTHARTHAHAHTLTLMNSSILSHGVALVHSEDVAEDVGNDVLRRLALVPQGPQGFHTTLIISSIMSGWACHTPI